jgi:hypothetical protein
MVAEPTNRPEPRYGSATIPKLLYESHGLPPLGLRHPDRTQASWAPFAGCTSALPTPVTGSTDRTPK